MFVETLTEIIPHDALTPPPPPQESWLCCPHIVNVDLYHDLINWWTVTTILHVLNGTPIDWYSKLKVHGSVCYIWLSICYCQKPQLTRSCTSEPLFRYLGIPIRRRCYMFGDNRSIVNQLYSPTLVSPLMSSCPVLFT